MPGERIARATLERHQRLGVFSWIRGLKSLTDRSAEPLGCRDGTHVDVEMIDPSILVEVQLIDHLKLLALDLGFKGKEVVIASGVRGQNVFYAWDHFGHLTHDMRCRVHWVQRPFSARGIE